jgi:hypothetical protein
MPALKGLSEEDVMVRLAGLAFHEHTHHYQVFSNDKVQENEDLANRIGGYILVTAKFVQLPLLRWVKPETGPADFQIIQTMYSEIKAREQAFIAPKPSDFAAYPDYRGKEDRGIIRLLPREKYEDKLSIRGGGAYFSFSSLDHNYANDTDIGFERKSLQVGFSGCNFGYFTNIGTLDLNQINDTTPGLKFLTTLKPGRGEPAIRLQQSRWEVQADGMLFTRTIQKIKTGQTYLLRSINFGQSDVLVAFKILRFDTDGSLILAWKQLRSFPISKCE